MKDKYAAVWVSHSSIGDYLKCPRFYFLRNVWRDPKTKHKVTVMTAPLALGQVVHDTIDEISTLTANERFAVPLLERFERRWQSVHGELGGFKNDEHEQKFKTRGASMLSRITQNPRPLLTKAVKIRQELPHYWISEEDDLILCGKIDWLQYNESDDSVSILDFKTGKNDEDEDSLQLPIYALLVSNCQKRQTKAAYYWYLDRDDVPLQMELPDLEQSKKTVLEIAKKIQLARKLNHFVCKKGGCMFCEQMEKIVRGEGKLVGESNYHQDIYILP